MRELEFSVAASIAAVIVAGAAAYKVRQLRRSTTNTSISAGYSLVTCLCAFALALALQSPLTAAGIDAVLGASATALAVAPALAMIATCGYQCFVVSINDPSSASRRIRWRIAIVTLAVTTLFVAVAVNGPAGHPALRAENPVSYRSDPSGAVAFLAYVGYLGLGALDITRLSYRFTRLGRIPLLRLGLLMVTAGTSLCGLYVAVKLIAFAVGLIVDRNLDTIATHATRPLVILSALLLSIGSTLPSWGRFVRAQRPAEWIGDYVSYLSLRPLWEALYAVKPQIALHPRSRWADLLLPGDLRFRLTRRVVEISDGLLLLRSYRTPEAHAKALDLVQRRSPQGTEPAAAVEAIEIALALRAMSHADPAGKDVETTLPPDPAAADFDGITPDIGGEVHWLTLVSHAFRRSPVVGEVLNDQPAFRAMATLDRGTPPQEAVSSTPEGETPESPESQPHTTVPSPRSDSRSDSPAVPGPVSGAP